MTDNLSLQRGIQVQDNPSLVLNQFFPEQTPRRRWLLHIRRQPLENRLLNVRFWPKADVQACFGDVCFGPEADMNVTPLRVGF